MSALEVEEIRTLALYGEPLKIATWKRLPIESLKVARKGTFYMLELDVSDLTPEKAAEAINALAKGLKENFNAQLIYATATKNKIYLQIRGSPFSWLALLAWLPTILGILGIILFGVSVWQAITSVPSWVWATLIIGGALILIGPTIGEWILSMVEKARGEKAIERVKVEKG